MAGFLQARLVNPEDVLVSDLKQECLAPLAERFRVRVTEDNKQAARVGDVVICAVKPAQVKGVLSEVTPFLKPDNLFISVAAGVTLSFIEANLPSGIPVIRAMPNVPALIGEGITALAMGKYAGAKEREEGEVLFGAVGRVVVLPEENLDAVTGLSGSGPAYISVILDALADGGVKMGLPRQVALDLALQTMIGTARMIQCTGDHPGFLKDRVASPGGSTIYGLHVLEAGGLRGLLVGAVEAASQRARTLHIFFEENKG
ncbi:MAG: pyrroline-5-carboxylate reductase [Bacillota bacterium]|nr:pyrroline-5-carboxylate reductase [Bacillota bacterium]